MFILASQKIADAFDKAMTQITVASLILMIGIMAAMVLFIVKYHHKRHPKPARIHGSMKLELLWTIIPTIISIWMFFVGYEGFLVIRTMPTDEESHIVYVTGRQWNWTFEHKDTGVTDSELVVPMGKPIKCLLTAPVDDVLHSFFIPHYKVKEDCVPGLQTHLWFQGDSLGKFRIFCTEFCGNDHAKMFTWLKVVTPEEFDVYLEEKMKKRFAPVTDATTVMAADSKQMLANVGSPADVKALYATYCQSCHGAEGEGGLVEGARSFKVDPASKWKRGVKLTDIFRTLTVGLEGTRMSAFDALSAWERFALSHYVANFYKDGPGRSKVSKAEVDKLIEEYQLQKQKPVVVKFPIEQAIDDMAKGQ
ncbi:MAG: cytochrome c oxidase subunit II [Planctomycetota bacterium]|nr:cytochrome c oxidase subunit II [Planctomycetota bacterium]